MESGDSSQAAPSQAGSLLLGIDTCGPSGSVALARLTGESLEILAQIELEGRSYSAALVSAVAELLARHAVAVNDLSAIVAVNGPGSFTGVRVGLSTVKGLAEASEIPVAAVSRLEVLASKAGVGSSALDAHRGQLFLRLAAADTPREMLAGAEELAGMKPVPVRVAVCDHGASALLKTAWPRAQLARTPAPTAADALHLSAARVAAHDFVDLALLDGHYLRRSDAEIFGDPAGVGTQGA